MMKQKNKIISVLLVIITIVNIFNISYASQENDNINMEIKEENLVHNSEEIVENTSIQEETENSKKDEIVNNEGSSTQENQIQQETPQEEPIIQDEIVKNEDEQQINNVIETVDQAQLHIINVDENNNPIAGNKYTVLRTDIPGYDAKDYLQNLTTDEQGRIDVTLFIGKFYIEQTFAVEGYAINKSLIELNYETGENITLTIVSQKPTVRETNKVLDKQIKYTEKNNNVIENNITNNSDIVVTNNNKEVINETITTKWNNVNNFINTIERSNVLTLGKNTTYNNSTQESNASGPDSQPTTISSNMTKLEFINYINEIMSESGIPILPVASR